MPKAVTPRELAKQDTDAAIDYYLSENAPEAALASLRSWSGHTAISAVIRALAFPDTPMN